MTNSGTLEKTARLVAWRVQNFDSIDSGITSEEFMIGKWYWHLELIKQDGKSALALKPKDKSISTPIILPEPIASVVIRAIYLTEIAQSDYTDLKILCGNGFSINLGKDIYKALDGKTPITFSLEFLDLKVEHDGKSYSIWDQEHSVKNLYEPVSKMLAETIYTDVVINTVNGSIEAHRAVLAANSPVFKTMFSKNYKEMETSTVNIMDMSKEACKAMLEFVYGKRGSNELRAHVMELLSAADKYDIVDLKKACEASLCENVGANNVFERLKCASMYGLQELKSTCLLYLVKMGMIFQLRDDYDIFLREADPEIIVDVANACLDPWKLIKRRQIKAKRKGVSMN